MTTRDYQFINGPETSTLPTAGTPTLDTDFMTKGYADANYGAGGGGGGAAWNPAEGYAPIMSEENGERVWLFDASLNQKLVIFIKVPEGYKTGKQIFMYLGHYSPSTSGTNLLKTSTYLVRADTDAASSTTNNYVSTNTAVTNTVADQYRKIQVALTDAIGKVNSVSVTAGDLLRVNLYRDTDTDNEDIRFIPSATELKFT